MCAAKELKMLNRLAMRLAGMQQHKAALVLLGHALRRSLAMNTTMQEARIRNNMALVLHMQGKDYLARRQIVRAMGLVAGRVGMDNRFYRTLQSNLLQTLHPHEQSSQLAEIAA